MGWHMDYPSPDAQRRAEQLAARKLARIREARDRAVVAAVAALADAENAGAQK